jgi:hypothetical protein
MAACSASGRAKPGGGATTCQHTQALAWLRQDRAPGTCGLTAVGAGGERARIVRAKSHLASRSVGRDVRCSSAAGGFGFRPQGGGAAPERG